MSATSCAAHQAHVGVVDAVGGEHRRGAFGVAGVDRQAVAHDQAMDRGSSSTVCSRRSSARGVR
jgi:hypothetical protein